MRLICSLVLLSLTTELGSSQAFWGFPLPKKETVVVPEVLELIGFKESRNNWKAVNLNKNGTRDWGRFQINDIAFKELHIKKGIPIPDKKQFLSDTSMQLNYALILLNHNDSILIIRGKPINLKNQVKAWAKSAYNI